MKLFGKSIISAEERKPTGLEISRDDTMRILWVMDFVGSGNTDEITELQDWCKKQGYYLFYRFIEPPPQAPAGMDQSMQHVGPAYLRLGEKVTDK